LRVGSFIHRTLAAEEPDLISVAMRPGMVDTDMQTDLRVNGVHHVTESHHARMKRAHADGTLVRPEDSGYVIAALAVRAPKDLSGKFVSWDGEECKAFRRQ